MGIHWTTPIMEEIDALDWGDGYPSDVQRKEMKAFVVRWRQVLENALGLYELQWRRGRQKDDLTL